MSAPAHVLALPEIPVTRAKRTPPYVARIPMTAEEFIAWDHGNRLADWVDGEAFIYMTTTNAHERVLIFLVALLDPYIRITRSGIIRRGPYGMRARPDGAVREPDLMFVLAEHAGRVTEQLLVGPADLVIEVVSDDSPTRDRRTKFREYEAAGIAEYWVIDPRTGHLKADFYTLVDGAYQIVPEDAEGRVHSAVLAGFWLRRAWLWDDDASPLRCLAEIVGPDRLAAALR